MNLNTGKVMVRPRVTTIPMTNAVRDQVEELIMQKMPEEVDNVDELMEQLLGR